jgi:molybdenum cofactor biosynthesis protein A, bacterial
MAEHPSFLPKADVLSLEEIDRLCAAFIDRGVERIRLTGGEPLVRRGIISLIESLGARLGSGLKEVTLTTNGSQITTMADGLAAAGVKRINISLDSLNADKFHAITRWGSLPQVLRGIDAALKAGLKVKINTVVLKGVNDGEVPDLIRWAHGKDMDLTLIETMPTGGIDGDRIDQFMPLSVVRGELERRFTLTPSIHRTGGPARYFDVGETGGRLGFITPLTHTFCESCNRVRLTCTGKLYLCLGQEDAADLRWPLRASRENEMLHAAIDEAIARKPKGHDFIIDRRHQSPAVPRPMSLTGG